MKKKKKANVWFKKKNEGPLEWTVSRADGF